MMAEEMEPQDEFFMREALVEAQKAAAIGEIPIGAVIVKDGQIIARGFNESITTNDPTAHAEIVAIRRAGQALNNYRLIDCELYVTLEPCMMCAGSFVHSRLKRIIFGAGDSRHGALGTQLNVNTFASFNHRVMITQAVLAEECRTLIRSFFKERRQQQKSSRRE
ncbi:tRNA adenosine(34) deaminase TadA [Wohlfahrtiimonas chitiniclastica]|uniref:tRNA-specific adenosine deaminase n=1 Tax=Wohlfahrtiimonas chitiniclastica TaxID=400946 RepID=A0AB35BYS3_9GAMM|nr:tRNA adenosine(34) deaminase TadA [Wohlfahrtiimonas chitiniclastica]MBS7824022.1 tRNA adenosine(34) deaminase TadA [Wohlfahrtiimonas chitiniclastica]MBS7839640.1 tRNA adenosine(34) deaminase TadA [Wohlfahrtiimonas chitiniclastica]